jgi:hypothetical protein
MGSGRSRVIADLFISGRREFENRSVLKMPVFAIGLVMLHFVAISVIVNYSYRGWCEKAPAHHGPPLFTESHQDEDSIPGFSGQ